MLNDRMAGVRCLVFLLFAVAAAACEACRVPPQAQLIGVDEQIGQATEVALGQVISATPLDGQVVEYRFLVLEQLAGAPRKVFTVTGRAGQGERPDSSFHDHADFAFWAHGGGRVMNGADCVIHPGFVVGNSYLVFLGSPATWRSFEQIDMVNGSANQDDKWLAYVKHRLGKGQPPAAPDYERVGRFIYGFHRLVTRDELERKTLAGQHAPGELLLRAGQLADEFDHIVRAGAKVPDAEIDATLREAAAVRAALKAWQDSRGAADGLKGT